MVGANNVVGFLLSEGGVFQLCYAQLSMPLLAMLLQAALRCSARLQGSIAAGVSSSRVFVFCLRHTGRIWATAVAWQDAPSQTQKLILSSQTCCEIMHKQSVCVCSLSPAPCVLLPENHSG